MATVVVDVLAVVGGVDRHCLRTLGTQHLNKAVEDMVGIKNSVVLCIYQILAVLAPCLHGDVGQETGELA